MKEYAMKRILKYATTFLIFFSLQTVFAQVNSGAQFLRLNIGSRAQGMGNAYTSIAANANGMHHNPAGLGFGLSREMMFFHLKYFQDISVENVTLMYPFTSRFSLGTSVSYLHMPELTRYEIDPGTGDPLEAGTFNVYNMVATTGLGFRLNDHFSLGANIKFFQEQLESVTASGVAFDAGLLLRVPGTGLGLGAAVQHFGPPVKYAERSETLPLTYKAGASYKIPGANSTVAVDVVKTEGQEMKILPGFEVGVGSSLQMRGGYEFDNAQQQAGFSAGFGLQLMDEHQINYVYVPYGDLGDTHRAEVVFHLGSPADTKPSFEFASRNSKSDKRAREIINTASRNRGRAVESAPTNINIDDIAGADVKPLPPENINLISLENGKMQLEWDASRQAGVSHHIYAKPVSGSKWIRVTPQPISRNYQIFTRTKSGVELMFVATTLRNGQESDFSQAITLEEDRSFDNRLQTVTNVPAQVSHQPAPQSGNISSGRPEVPTGINVHEVAGNRIKLEWDASLMPDVRYHIYAKPLNGSKWIRVTPDPVKENHRVFTKRRGSVNLIFVVTAVNADNESDFSEPVYLESN